MAGRYSSIPVAPPPYYQQPYQAEPKYPVGYSYTAVSTPSPIAYSPYSPAAYSGNRSSFASTHKQHKRRCIDYPTTLLLILVWTFLLLSCAVLLYFTHVARKSTSDNGEIISTNEVAGTILLTAAPVLIATILNEVLIDRCWRRVVYSALGKKAAGFSNEELAKRLRAANFEWLNFLKRLCKGSISRYDIGSLASYGLLRWGTAVSIASIQLCVSWKPADDEQDAKEYTATKRYVWIFGPVFLHMCSVFGTMLIWLMPPWRFFSDRFHDPGLLRKYKPYLDRVPNGSIAKYDTVAESLDPRTTNLKPLARVNEPGIQFWAKFKGIWFGLIGMNIPPALAGAFFKVTSSDDILKNSVYRFVFHFVFLAQNIVFLQALDFAVWNVSLEGFCKRAHSSPNKNLRHLGHSSGIMLLLKAVKQRKPVRAAVFMWLFWFQACSIRCLTVLFTFSMTLITYGSYSDRADFYDPQFWLAWIILTNLFALPLFLSWLITRFQVPICEQDGWRWAKIAQNALVEPGYYGVRNGEATWGADVETFEACKGQVLI